MWSTGQSMIAMALSSAAMADETIRLIQTKKTFSELIQFMVAILYNLITQSARKTAKHTRPPPTKTFKIINNDIAPHNHHEHCVAAIC